MFTHHHAVADGIIDALRYQQIKHIRIDGREKAEDRHTLANEFNRDRKMLVAVGIFPRCHSPNRHYMNHQCSTIGLLNGLKPPWLLQPTVCI